MLRQSHFDRCVVLCCAEQNADGRILLGKFLYAIVVVDIHLQLSYILMRELACL